MERCPSCKARFKGSASCYRCGADFTPLLRIDDQVKSSMSLALSSYRCGDFSVLDDCIRTIRILGSTNPVVNTLVHFLSGKLKGPIIKRMGKVDDSVNTQLFSDIMDSAKQVHKEIGFGLQLSAYENCLGREFSLRNLAFKRNCPVVVHYKGLELGDVAYINYVVENKVAVVLSSSRQSFAQCQTHAESWIRLGGWPFGLLIDFDAAIFER